MNENLMKGRWNQIKGEIQKMWGDLTGDDLEKTKGNLKSITGLIQERYGASKEEVTRKLNNIVSGAESATAEGTEAIKDEIRHH